MKKNNNIKAEINVVPFIDVILVLLIVFMITAPMLTQGIDVSLPKTSSSDNVDLNTENVFFIISIDKDGNFYLTNSEDEDLSSTPIEIVSLTNIIKNYEESNTNKEIKLFIKADENVQYGQVVKLMDELKRISKNSIGLMTEKSD